MKLGLIISSFSKIGRKGMFQQKSVDLIRVHWIDIVEKGWCDTVYTPKEWYEWILGESHLRRSRRKWNFCFTADSTLSMPLFVDCIICIIRLICIICIISMMRMICIICIICILHKPVVFKRMICVRLLSFDNASNRLGRIQRCWMMMIIIMS